MEIREHYSLEKRQALEVFKRLCQDSQSLLELGLEAAETRNPQRIESIRIQAKNLKASTAYLTDLVAHIIALEQPVATDLRTFITYMKIGSDFERVAEHAVSLAESGIKIDAELLGRYLDGMRTMVVSSISMLSIVLKSHYDHSVQNLEAIPRLDDAIDRVYREIVESLTTELREGRANIEDGVALIMLVRFLERTGDHVTNIAEWIHFATSGEHRELNG